MATQTYQHNFPTAHVETSRLENVDIAALRRRLGTIDILLSSPECTNHTCAKGSAPRNETSRATAMRVVEYARAFMPRWFVLENVVHMRPWSRYGELKQALRDLGYNIAEQVLEAAHFGVPQKRRRLFLVGDRRRPPLLVKDLSLDQEHLAVVESVLDPDGTWGTSPLFSVRRASGTLDRAWRAFAALGLRTPFLVVYYGSDGSGGWQPLTKPLRTVTTIDRFALVTPGSAGHRMRMLQVPELRRAMGFDETYELPVGTRRDRIRLLGNAICPPVMAGLVRTLTMQNRSELDDTRPRHVHVGVRNQVH